MYYTFILRITHTSFGGYRLPAFELAGVKNCSRFILIIKYLFLRLCSDSMLSVYVLEMKFKLM